jgi:hypothetical protein
MDDSKKTQQRFVGYPRAVEGPNIPYKEIVDKNPVFSGNILMIGAWMLVSQNLNPNEGGADLFQCLKACLHSKAIMGKCGIQLSPKARFECLY